MMRYEADKVHRIPDRQCTLIGLKSQIDCRLSRYGHHYKYWQQDRYFCFIFIKIQSFLLPMDIS